MIRNQGLFMLSVHRNASNKQRMKGVYIRASKARDSHSRTSLVSSLSPLYTTLSLQFFQRCLRPAGKPIPIVSRPQALLRVGPCPVFTGNLYPWNFRDSHRVVEYRSSVVLFYRWSVDTR